ncbi:MAG: helix-turn-helix transcriptional regulator [Planctomycetes bacterium]|nr:helix-turn-helix transcriptional regulator [Planctomycetota bacterium]
MGKRRTRTKKRLEVLIGERVEALRADRGLTRSALAREAGVALTSMNLLEAGRVKPSLGTLGSLAKALGVRVVDLLDDEPPAAKPTGGSTTFYRLLDKLRDRSDDELRAVEKLVAALDKAVEGLGR